MDDSLYSDFGNISGRTLFRLASKELPKFSTPVPVFQLKKKPSRRGRRATRLSSPSLDENITPQTLIRNFCKEQIARNSPPFVPKEDEIFRIQRGRNRSRRSSRALPELEETSVEENETTEDRSLLPDITDISAIESGPKKRKLQLGRLNPPLTFRKLQKTHSPANAEHLACSSSLQGSSRTTSVRRKQNASPMTSDSLSSDFECPSDINLNTKVVKGSPVPVKQKPFSEKEIPHLLFDSEASSTIPSGKLNLQRRSRAPLFPNRKSNDLSVSLPLLSERVSVSASSEKNSLNNIHQSTARPSRQSDKNISSNSSQFQEPDGAAFAEVRPQTSNIRMASKSGGFHEPSDADVESSNEEEEASIHTQDTSVADDINQLTESCERNPSAVKSMSRISQSEYFERGLTSRSLPHSTPQVSQHSPLEGLEEQISADQNIGCDVAAQSIKKPKTSERTSLAHKSMSRVSESEHREDGLTSRSLNRSKQVSLHAPISDSDEEASNDPNIGCSVSVQSVKKPKTSERTSLARKSMSRVSESEHLEDGLTSRSLNRSKQVSLHAPISDSDEEASNDPNVGCSVAVQSVKKPKTSERTSLARKSMSRVSESEHLEDGLTSRSLNRSKQVSLHAPISDSDEEASNDPNVGCSVAVQSVKKPETSERTSLARKSMSRVSESEHLEDGLTSRTLNREDGLTSRSLNRSKQVSFHVPLSGSDEEASNDPNIALSIATPSVQKSTARKSTSFRQQKSVSQVSVSDRSQKKSVASPSGDVSNQENADVIPHDFEDSVHAVQQKHKISLQKSHHAFRRAGYSTEEIELSQSMSPVKIPSKLSETISLTQNKSALQRISSQNSTRVPSASPQDNEGIDFDCVSHVTKHVTRGTIDRDEEKSVSKRRSQKDKTPQTAISHLPKTVSRTSVSQQDDNKSPSYFINQPNISMHGTPQVFEDATYQAPRQTRIPDKNTTRGSRKSGHLTKASESEPSTSLALSIRPSDTGSVKKKMHSTAIQDSNETVSAIQNVSVAISPIRKKLLSGKYVMLSSDDDKNEMEHSAGNSDECDESADDMHAKEFPLLSDVQDHEQEHMSEEELGAPSASHIQKKHRVKKSRAPRISALDTKHFVEQFAGMKLSRGALNTILESTDIFWENTFEALQAYSKHANRQTIDVEDVELLLYRQRLVHDRRSINALIAEYMPMELRRKLIPMAVPKCSLP